MTSAEHSFGMKNLSMMAKRRNKSCLFCFCLSYSYICRQKCPTSLSAIRIIEKTKESGLSIHKNIHFDVYGDTICQFQLLSLPSAPINLFLLLLFSQISICAGENADLITSHSNNFKHQIDKRNSCCTIGN